MKSNIDLTENRDFMQKSSIPGSIDSFLLSILKDSKSAYPWNSYFDILEEGSLTLESKPKELVFTGDKEERKSKKYHSDWGANELIECDRCGAYTKKYPWDMNDSTLCKSCEDYIVDKGGKIAWRGRVLRP